MTTRKAPENCDENPAKRRRILDSGNDAAAGTDVSFSSLHTDCKVHIFSFLPNKYLNIVAQCSKACNEARNNESLDQKRTGIIVWTNETTNRDFCRKLRENQLRFNGNMTCLKVVGRLTPLNDDDDEEEEEGEDMDGVVLDSVTCLDCSGLVPRYNSFPFDILCQILPNLVELNVTDILEEAVPLEDFGTRCPSLARISWENGKKEALQCGHDFANFTNLTQLYVDNIDFSRYFISGSGERVRAAEDPECYLFMKCRNLERLSLKDATYLGSAGSYDDPPLSLPQDMLIKMVRCHPTLRWLRSDLSRANVAMLQQERPDITFVSR